MSAEANADAANTNTDAANANADAEQAGGENTLLSQGEGQTDQSGDPDVSAQNIEPVEGAPEQYEEFAVPEGVQLDQEMLSEFSATAKELNLTQDKAQQMVDMGSKLIDNALATQKQQWAEVRQGWVSELKADPDFGGSKMDTTIVEAKTVLDRYGDSQLKTFLLESGFGDNASLIKMFARIARATAEDTVVNGTVPTDKKSPESVLYDKTE